MLDDDGYFAALAEARLHEQRYREWVQRRIGELAEEFTVAAHADGWLPAEFHFEYGSVGLDGKP